MKPTPIARTVLMLLVAGLPAGALAQPDLSAVEEQIVTVRAFDRTDAALGDISGLVAGGGLVVTSAQMLSRAQTVMVIGGGGQEHPAAILRRDTRSGVAILEAEGLETAGPMFGLDDPDADPEEGDLAYVPRFAADGTLQSEPALGSIAEVRRVDAVRPGDRAVLIYRHNARVSAREYGMPMLNWCGEVTGLVRPDPDLSLRALNDRADPGESTYGVSGAEVRRALADVDAEVEVAPAACPEPDDAVAILEAEAQRAREAAEGAAAEAAAARERAEAAEARAAGLAADVDATQAERDAAKAEAEQLRAAADEQEAELDDLEQRAAGARAQAEQAQGRVTELEEEQRWFRIGLAALGAVLLASGIVSWRLLRRRRRQLDAADAARHEAEEQRRRSEQELAGAVRPASFSCLLEGADESGGSIVVKIEAAQLGASEGVVVGRSPARAGVLLDHPQASREHFRLTARGADLFVEDLNSTNGTFVNGEALEAGRSARLSDGDEIGIGAAIRVRVALDPSTP